MAYTATLEETLIRKMKLQGSHVSSTPCPAGPLRTGMYFEKKDLVVIMWNDTPKKEIWRKKN